MKKYKGLIALAVVACLGFILLTGCGKPASDTGALDGTGDNAPATQQAPDTDANNGTGDNATAQQTPDTDEYIGEDAAKAAALAHAGLAESDVTFVRVQLDRDDGHWEYEVEFFSGNVEYDYDIDALTGDIRAYEMDND